MKFKAYKLVMALVGASFVLSACGAKETIESDNETRSEVSSEATVDNSKKPVDTGVVTVSDLKQKYGVENRQEYKPFYNVEQGTQFTFHFNSQVEPCRAITVHTDSKCEESSTVYQINDGYKTDTGVDVVVKAGSPVLNCDTHSGGSLANYNWGYAPIYYMCIRYDMDASTPVLLDEPIVIPFTVRSEVSVPNTYYTISPTGNFTVNWKPVEGAVKYNIYSAFRVRPDSAARELTRAEAGYIGDHLEKIGTVDGNTFSFSEFGVVDGSVNILRDDNGHVFSQNTFDLGSYYVTAVDDNGNESFFSLAVEGWKYGNQLPKEFIEYDTFRTEAIDIPYVTYLPMSVPVVMYDGSVNYFPINYTKSGEEYDYVIYDYSIVGTELTGSVRYFNESGVYEDNIISTDKVNGDLYKVDDEIHVIPSKEVQTLSGDYNLDLSKPVDRDQSTKLIYSKDALLKRADIENARIVTDGVYVNDGGLESIETYLADGFNSTQNVVENTDSSVVESTTVDGSSSVESTEVENTEVESTAIEEESTSVSETVAQEEQLSDGVVTSDNLVDTQTEITNQEVADADTVEIAVTGYPVWADSAEEEYLALAMINRQDSVDISAFPALQNMEYLKDVFYKVTFQNPYIISPMGLSYDYNTNTIYPVYAYDLDTTKKKQEEIAKSIFDIVDSVITADMTDEAKVQAVWSYLEDNTNYDYSALEAAEKSEFSLPVGYEDSFNAYGILVNKVGVCQSYSYASKLLLNACGVDSVTLTGYLNGTLPHAWNAVSLDENWYWVDTTNNELATGIPYFMYQTSSDFAEQINYVLDTDFELDTNLGAYLNSDTSKDWYSENDLYAMGDEELISMLANQYESTSRSNIAVKCAYEPVIDEPFVMDFCSALVEKGATKEEILNMKFGYSSGYFILAR